MNEVVDDISRPGHISSGAAAQRLPEGPRQYVDAVRFSGSKPIVLRAASATRTEHTDAMRVVDDEGRVESSAQLNHRG